MNKFINLKIINKMKKLTYILFFALAGIFLYSCESDIEKVQVKASPVAPVLTVAESITLDRDKSSDSLSFAATEADFGFQAAITYYLEAAVAGTNFESPIEIASQELDPVFKMTVSEFNNALIQQIPESQTTNMEMRVRAAINASNVEVSSDAKQVTIRTYGPPSLYLVNDAHGQRLVSANNDSIYTGWIYTDGTAFTLRNGDNDKIYGLTSGVVTENGDPIVLAEDGYQITVNLNNSTFESAVSSWGIIGSAIPPYDWSEDITMVWDFDNNVWTITGDFVQGEFKFRKDDDWAVNFGDNDFDGSLEQDGANIPLSADGNYTITLDVDNATYTVTKN